MTESDAVSEARGTVLRASRPLGKIAAVILLLLAIASGGMAALQWSTVSNDRAAAEEADAWVTTGMVGASPEELAFAQADADRAHAELRSHATLAAGFLAGSLIGTGLAVAVWLVSRERRG